jgi:hypothetical protein
MLKFIEFVSCDNDNNLTLLTLELNSILGFQYFNEKKSILFMKEGRQFHIIGNHRTLMNRLMYVLNMKKDTSYDYIARPSTAIFNNYKTLCVDNTFFENYQLYSFVKLLSPELLSNDFILSIFNLAEQKKSDSTELIPQINKTKQKTKKFKDNKIEGDIIQ